MAVVRGEASFSTCELRAELLGADGSVVKDYGVVGRKKITKAWVSALVNVMAAGAIGDFQSFKYHHTGTGTAAEVNTDTGLQTSVESRAAGDQTPSFLGGNTYQYTTVVVITYASPWTITEHGVFSQPTGGTLMDRTVLSQPISVQAGGQVRFSYSTSISAEA